MSFDLLIPIPKALFVLPKEKTTKFWYLIFVFSIKALVTAKGRLSKQQPAFPLTSRFSLIRQH